MGRGGLTPYGGGSMLMGGDAGPQGKVGMYIVKPSSQLVLTY